MEDISIFTNKEVVPTPEDLSAPLGASYPLWIRIEEMVYQKYPAGVAGWTFPGKKYGWNFRIRDKKRAIIYLLPRTGYFLAALVFGEKACQAVKASPVAEEIKTALREATPYAEGRGIRLEVRNDALLGDLERLIDIKLSH